MDDKQARWARAFRAVLPWPRRRQAAAYENAPTATAADEPSRGFHVFTLDPLPSAKATCVRRSKDKIVFSSSARANLCDTPHVVFVPCVEARLQCRQMVTGSDIFLRFDLRFVIRWPYVLDRKVALTVVPGERADMTVHLIFLEHPAPHNEHAGSVMFYTDKILQSTKVDGVIDSAPNCRSGVGLLFCRTCDMFMPAYKDDGSGGPVDEDAATRPRGIYTQLAAKETAVKSEEEEVHRARDECARHRLVVAQCTLQIAYRDGYYHPKLCDMRG